MTGGAMGNRWDGRDGRAHALLLGAVLACVSLTPPEFYTVLLPLLLAGYLLLAPRPRANPGSAPLMALGSPLLISFACGAVLAMGNQPYDVLKDVWYFLKVFCCLVLGYQMGLRLSRSEPLLRVLGWVSALLALAYLVRFAAAGAPMGLERALDAGEIALLPAFGVAILIGRDAWRGHAGSWLLRGPLLLLTLTAFALSFSRVALGILVIAVAAHRGLLDNRRRLFVVAGLLLGMAAAVGSAFDEADFHDGTFAFKVVRSIRELSFAVGDDRQDMIWNWRGFEAYWAYQQFLAADPLQALVGGGFGATVDFGRVVDMGDGVPWRYLPILHNGYFHVLTKYGVIGLLAYLLFMWRLLAHPLPRGWNPHPAWAVRAVRGIGLVAFFTTLAITGIFNKNRVDPLLILCGACYGLMAAAQAARAAGAREVEEGRGHDRCPPSPRPAPLDDPVGDLAWLQFRVPAPQAPAGERAGPVGDLSWLQFDPPAAAGPAAGQENPMGDLAWIRSQLATSPIGTENHAPGPADRLPAAPDADGLRP